MHGVFVGLATLDVVHRVTTPPGPNQKVTALGQSVATGGPATNAALTFAGLGGSATLVTALGRGGVAALIRRDLDALGVRVLDATPEMDDDPPVSAVAVTEATGQRAVVSQDAVTARPPVPPALAELVGAADVVLADGHYPTLTVAAGHAARAAGTRLVVDAGRWKPAMAELIPLATDLVCSADFRLPGQGGDPGQSLAGRVPAVVITAGAAPVRWWAGGINGALAVPAVAVRDTLGAGDAFHGGYAFHDRPLPERLVLAIGVATRRCEAADPRAWLAELRTWRHPENR